MKLSRPILIPALLLVYLIVMAILGLDGLRSGQTTLVAYIATIVITLGVIILLHFFLKKREHMREERRRQQQDSDKQ